MTGNRYISTELLVWMEQEVQLPIMFRKILWAFDPKSPDCETDQSSPTDQSSSLASRLRMIGM